MKKFLSLVLALIMTMSLVTISAGATEYRDLTDKDEIQYEEAVAVLNRIGVITGYDDGSFRPETELTRGAAAKIIVSLLIGPEAAGNLPNATAPYPDVPASHTFAGVISYCKTAGIISGYGDGTFKPGNSLTGYAFAKMLLGALGYKAEVEGFIDTGWTMNVARVGNVVGLFDRLDFDGSAAVTREEACQLALNTLKATMVTYGGTTLVTGANQAPMYVQGTQAMYVTSNNREINANINRRVISAQNNEMTLEFGEEHFKDLRLEHDKYDPAYDDYGHPSNEWSYKKVTIGTFKLPADFTYTKQMAHLEDTTATKEKALGLRGYDTWSIDHRANYTNWSTAASGSSSYYGTNSPFNDVTQIHVNGWHARSFDGKLETWEAPKTAASAPANGPTISEICDLTDNGVTVEVYVCPVDADFITDVVVTRTQLMEVRRVASDYVSLDQVDSDSKDESLTAITGYNDHAIDDDNNGSLIDVKDSNYDAYNTLKDLKAGDKVAVVPYTADNGRTWEAGEVYVPEEVSGALTKSTGYSTSALPKGNAVTVTVGGTEYPIAQWNKDLRGIDANLIKATRKDVTLLLDKMGNALLAKDTGNADDWMVICDYYQAAASNGGKVVWFAHGKSLDGKEDIDVNVGTIRDEAEMYAPGSIVHYDIASRNNGEYQLDRRPDKSKAEGAYEVAGWYMDGAKMERYEITSKNQLVPLVDLDITEKDGSYVYSRVDVNGTDPDVADPISFTYQPAVYSKVKFIFVDFDSKGEVDTFIVKDGPVGVDWEDLRTWNEAWKNIGTNDQPSETSFRAEAHVNNKGEVDAVVIKNDNGEASLSNIILTTDTTRDEEVDSEGVKWHGRKITRGSDSFKGEDTVMLDKFTEVGEFSRVVKETEDGGTKKLEVKKIGGDFDNDALEPIQVTGIDYVRNNNGSKNTKLGFRVGQTNGYRVIDLEGNVLTADPSSNGKIHADFMTNETTMGDSVLSVEKIEGLIRVNSSTKILDLRRIQDDRIDDLEELVDHEKYDLSKTKLSILFNADSGSDGFRYAYLIAVTEAVELKPYPVDLTISSENRSFVLDEGYDRSNTLVLTASFTKLSDGKPLKDADVSYSWSIDGKSAGETSKTLTLPVGLTAGDHTVKVTVTPLAKDTSPYSMEVTVTVRKTTGVESGTGSSSVAESQGTVNSVSSKTELSSGQTRVTLDITAPDWAYGKAGADATNHIVGVASWKTTVDDVEYTGKINLYDSRKTLASNEVAVKGDAAGTAFTGSAVITGADDPWAETKGLTEAIMKGKTANVEITGIEWKFAKVEYKLGEEDYPAAKLTDAKEFLPVAEEGTLTIHVNALPDGQVAEAEDGKLDYAVTGAVVSAPEGGAAGKLTVSSATTLTAKAEGSKVVTVAISGLIDDPADAEYTVKTIAALEGKLLFAVADSTTAPAEDSAWTANKVEGVKAGQYVHFKPANELGTLTTASSNAKFVDADGAIVSITVNDAGYFQMPAVGDTNPAPQDLTMNAVVIAAPEVEAFTLTNDWKLNVKLAADPGAATTDQLLKLVADEIGATVVPGAVDSNSVYALTYRGHQILATDITISHTLTVVTIDGGETKYVDDANPGTTTIGDVLALAGMSIENAGQGVFVLPVKDTAVQAGIATNNLTGTVDTGVTDIKINGGKGYAKMAATALVAIPTTSKATGLADADVPTLDFEDTPITDTASAKYLPIGEEVTVVATFPNAINAGTLTGGVQIVADGASTNATVEVVSSEEVEKNAAVTASDTLNVVVKITAASDTGAAIKLKTADLTA